MLSSLKSKIGHSKLRKKLKEVKRDKKVYNLITARRVGMLIYVSSDTVFKQALEFVSYLNQQNLDVCILAFYPGKEIPQQYLLRKNVNIFNKKELNWYNKPMAPFVEEFIGMDFDMLIDLSTQELFPLKWIASLSIAKFKVGNLSYYGSPNDLIINIKSEDNIQNLIIQMKHYLYLINNRFAQEQVQELEN
jgi:hypothetical protein